MSLDIRSAPTGEPNARLLEGRRAVVTGGGDIGSAVARELWRQGAEVEVWDRSRKALNRIESAPEQIRGTRVVDLTSSSQLEEAIANAVSQLGHIDVMVNTAAIATFAPVVDMHPDMWRETIEVDLTGVFLACRGVIGHMMERKSGAIVNFSSIGGLRGEPEFSHYSAAKFGVIGFTQALAREIGPYGVRANCVCPGAIVSTMNTDTLARDARRLGVSVDEIERQVVSRTPLRRLGLPTEVANAVIFLASDLASFITGEALSITGGIH